MLQNKFTFLVYIFLLLPAKMQSFHVNKIYGRNVKCEEKKQEAGNTKSHAEW